MSNEELKPTPRLDELSPSDRYEVENFWEEVGLAWIDIIPDGEKGKRYEIKINAGEILALKKMAAAYREIAVPARRAALNVGESGQEVVALPLDVRGILNELEIHKKFPEVTAFPIEKAQRLGDWLRAHYQGVKASAPAPDSVMRGALAEYLAAYDEFEAARFKPLVRSIFIAMAKRLDDAFSALRAALSASPVDRCTNCGYTETRYDIPGSPRLAGEVKARGVEEPELPEGCPADLVWLPVCQAFGKDSGAGVGPSYAVEIHPVGTRARLATITTEKEA